MTTLLNESNLIVFVLILRRGTTCWVSNEAIDRLTHWHSHLDSTSIHRTWLLLGHVARLLLRVECLLLLLSLMVSWLTHAIVHHELHFGCLARVLHLLLLDCHVHHFLLVLLNIRV